MRLTKNRIETYYKDRMSNWDVIEGRFPFFILCEGVNVQEFVEACHRFPFGTINARVLEVGSGIGILLKQLADDGFEKVIASDISMSNCTKCSKRGLPCLNATAHKLPFASETFDIIIAKAVIEHMDERVFLSEARRTLKDNGYLVIDFPGKWGTQVFGYDRLYLRFVKRSEIPKHSEYSLRQVYSLLNEHSFLVSEVKTRSVESIIMLIGMLLNLSGFRGRLMTNLLFKLYLFVCKSLRTRRSKLLNSLADSWFIVAQKRRRAGEIDPDTTRDAFTRQEPSSYVETVSSGDLSSRWFQSNNPPLGA